MGKPYFIRLLFALACLTYFCSGIQLNIVTISASSNAGSGVEPMQSAFAVAMEDMIIKYPRLYQNHTRTNLTLKENVCKDYEWTFPSNVSSWYGKGYFDRPGLTIILTSICNLVASYIGDFAREMAIPTMACATGFPDNPRYSTVISLSPGSIQNYAQALVTLMKMNNWTYISLIHDNLTGVVEAGRPVAITTMFRQVFNANLKIVNCKYFTTDSVTSSVDDLRYVMTQASQHSRLIIISTLTIPMRKLLAAAYDLNMTNGDYVFFCIYTWQVPGEAPLTWNKNDSLDAKVLAVMKSVIILTSPLTNWPRWNETGVRVNRFRERTFNTSYDEEKIYNDFAITCYGAAELISQVLDEILTEDHIPEDGKAFTYDANFSPQQLIQRVSHRTNQLTFENITFVPGSGWRVPDIILQQFNTTTNSFDVRYFSHFKYYSQYYTVAFLTGYYYSV
ncbi:atrial natriuretic peptide receptor 3-like [Paramacrobiotus metropolitanus]|uniref:atrial natriuretic peptide receptor 3-like n=1 Tax=Paramacrobiotus metropolitanus TaxID=2943436 RepID=UPI002445DF26|nr:atrial natriuretic peptide receptor 3-like [Paramacrobiotus metropolitanus]